MYAFWSLLSVKSTLEEDVLTANEPVVAPMATSVSAYTYTLLEEDISKESFDLVASWVIPLEFEKSNE